MTESPFINQFIAQGEAKGLAKGRVEGRAEGGVLIFLRMLAEKFQSVPEDLVAAIQHETDLSRLTMWTSAAFKAKNLDEFRTVSRL